MSEKTNLLPSAPTDDRFVMGQPHTEHQQQQAQFNMQMPKLIIVPGLEFDPARNKPKYGMLALGAAVLLLISFVMVEARDCNGGPGIDLDTVQALHISLMVFTFVLYLLSLFGIADFLFQYKYLFMMGVLIIYVFTALMIWMTYEAAVNPCAKTGPFPVDLSFSSNVFSRGDGVGIIVLFLDIFATLMTISAATSFCKRY